MCVHACACICVYVLKIKTHKVTGVAQYYNIKLGPEMYQCLTYTRSSNCQIVYCIICIAYNTQYLCNHTLAP